MKSIIRVEGLSKRYRIGVRRGSHETLRETLHEALRAPLKRLRRRYSTEDSIWALREISFDVTPGEVVGIIGRNGAGKSTLLKVLSRIVEPTAGRVELYGRVGSLLEVGTGFHPELSGRENIYLNGAILGMKESEIRRKFDEIVTFAEIERFLDTAVKYYSSGMYMRLAFAVAAHMDPEILVVDEVLAVGDASFQKKCLGKMEDVAKRGRTILFVSHQMTAIQNLCSRTILLSDGKISADGETEAVIGKYLEESSNRSQTFLAERDDRQGTGEIRFVSLKLLNGEGQEVTALRSGRAATLVLGYENLVGQDLNNLQLAIGIDNQSGQRIMVLSNEVTGEIFPTVPAQSTSIGVDIERLPLMPGRYSFTIYCALNGRVVDWVQEAGRFYVEPGDYYGTGRLPAALQGDFLVNHHFRLPENSLHQLRRT
jgi:homopolymeric O-antigen transport system ATP-binding protein